MSFDVAPLDLKAISAVTSNATKDKEVHSRKQSIVGLIVFFAAWYNGHVQVDYW